MADLLSEDSQVYTCDAVGWPNEQIFGTADVQFPVTNFGILDVFYLSTGNNVLDTIRTLGPTTYVTVAKVGDVAVNFGSPTVTGTNATSITGATVGDVAVLFGSATVTGDITFLTSVGGAFWTSQLGPYTVSYSAVTNVQVSGFNDGENIGTPSVNTESALTNVGPSGINSGLIFGAPTVTTTGFTNVIGTGFDNAALFGTPVVKVKGWAVVNRDSQTWTTV